MSTDRPMQADTVKNVQELYVQWVTLSLQAFPATGMQRCTLPYMTLGLDGYCSTGPHSGCMCCS